MKKLPHLKKYSELALHLIFWIIIIASVVVHYWPFSDLVSDEMTQAELAEMVLMDYQANIGQMLHLFFLVIFKAIFFYVNVFLIFPKYKPTDSRKMYLLPLLFNLGWCFTAEFLFFTLAENNIFYPNLDAYYWGYEYSILASGIIPFMLVLAVSFGYWASRQWLLHKEGLQKLDVTTAELALLKNQVNPHFLFNTLNNLFSMAIEKNADELAESISQLTHLMRYSIYESQVPFIELYREVEYIENYIKLQKLRFTGDEPIVIRFDVDGDLQQVRISPMLLINFVENAFKHGVSLKQDSYILIDLKVTDEELKFTVENTIHRQSRTASVAHAGFGQEHVKKLLEIQYPNRHTLTITEESKIYRSVLRLQLQKTQVAITALQ